MKIYAISDTHFNHKMLVEKGYRPEDFEARILDSIFKLSGDILIHCGDFAIGQDELGIRMYMDAAKNFKKKILVRGNHDGKSDAWYTDRGFDFVCESFVNKYFGKRLIFTHIPVAKSDRFDLNIHGHMHGNAHRYEGDIAKLYDTSFHRDLAPEIRDYAPVNLQNIV